MQSRVERQDEPEQRSTDEVRRDYGLPEHAPERELRGLTRVAAALCGTSTAVVNLLDDGFQHQIGAVGFNGARSPVEDSMCAAAVRRPELRYVPDARLEPDFAQNPWVDGRLAEVRLYLSAPMVLSDGRVVGSLCVFDDQPGEVDQVRRDALGDLATQAVALIEQAREARAAVASAALLRLVAESPSDLLSRHRLDGTVLWMSPSSLSVLGREAADLVGQNPSERVHPEDQELLAGVVAGVAEGRSGQAKVRQRHADGSWRWLEVLLSPLVLDDGEVQVHSVARDITARVQAEDELLRVSADLASARDEAEQREAVLSAVLDTIEVGVVACDAAGHLTLFNRASRDFHGLLEDPSLDASERADRYALFHADGRTPLAPDDIPLFRALHEGRVSATDIVIAPEGLPARLVRCNGRALHDQAGRLIGAVVAQTDETAARAAVDALRQSEQRFRSAFADGPAPMAHLDEDGRVTDVNAALRRFLSLRTPRLVGRRLVEVVLPADADVLDQALHGAGDGRSEPVELRVVRADGVASWCELACTRITGPDGVGRTLVQLVDVDARKQAEDALISAARRDALTGVANREGLADRLHQLLHPDSPTAGALALLFVDLDRFKLVNDLAGHEAGDAVLQETARRLRQAVRADDIVARIGGDEFVVVLPGATRAAAAGLRDRLPEALAQPVLVSGTTHRVGASIGLAFGAVGDDPAALLARADSAMYEDKRARATRNAPPPIPTQGQGRSGRP